MGNPVRIPVHGRGDRLTGPGDEPVQIVRPEIHHAGGVRHHRTAPQGGQPFGFTVDQLLHPPGQHGAGLADPVQFLADLRDNALGGIRGGRGAQVRNVVQQRTVCFVSDGADNGRGRRSHRTDQVLVAEGQQILQRSAAAGDDDDVDVLAGVEFSEGPHHLGHRVHALDGNLAHLELDRRPAQRGVPDDVLHGVRIPPGDEADAVRQQRQALLARRSNRPSAASARRSRSSRTSRSPSPTGRMSRVCMVSRPVLR